MADQRRGAGQSSTSRGSVQTQTDAPHVRTDVVDARRAVGVNLNVRANMTTKKPPHFQVVINNITNNNGATVSAEPKTAHPKKWWTDMADNYHVCGVCYQEYNEKEKTPRLLTCGHTFCTECLNKVVHHSNSIYPTCPECRKKTVCKVDAIPINFQLIKVLGRFCLTEENPGPVAPLQACNGDLGENTVSDFVYELRNKIKELGVLMAHERRLVREDHVPELDICTNEIASIKSSLRVVLSAHKDFQRKDYNPEVFEVNNNADGGGGNEVESSDSELSGDDDDDDDDYDDDDDDDDEDHWADDSWNTPAMSEEEVDIMDHIDRMIRSPAIPLAPAFPLFQENARRAVFGNPAPAPDARQPVSNSLGGPVVTHQPQYILLPQPAPLPAVVNQGPLLLQPYRQAPPQPVQQPQMQPPPPPTTEFFRFVSARGQPLVECSLCGCAMHPSCVNAHKNGRRHKENEHRRNSGQPLISNIEWRERMRRPTHATTAQMAQAVPAQVVAPPPPSQLPAPSTQFPTIYNLPSTGLQVLNVTRPAGWVMDGIPPRTVPSASGYISYPYSATWHNH